MFSNNYIDQFMWGYQEHYYICLKSFAEKYFNSILSGIFNQVFIVGTLLPGEQDNNAVCIQQEDDFYEQNDFQNVSELYNQFLQVSPGNHIFQSHPIAQQHHRQNVEAGALRDAIKQCIEQKSVFYDVLTFVSTSVPIGKYNVSLVLQLNKNEYDSFYKLNKISYHNIGTSKSIIDSAVPLFFTEAKKYLLDEESDGFDLARSDIESLIKQAGIDFFYSVSCKGDNGEGLHGLFEAISNVSSLPYESSEAIGKIIIARKNHENVQKIFTFKQKYSVRQPRLIRKLLELTSDDLSLLCDSSEIYGIGKIIGEYNPVNEDLFEIHITGHFLWKMIHDNKTLLQVKYGKPYLPKTIFSIEEFFTRTRRIFKKITDGQLFNLFHCINSIVFEHKGGILVITDHAKEESERLSKQSILIEPTALTPDSIKKLTSIDGAILIDTDCICYSIGTILDGLASDNGNPERGSRYNSSVRYCDYRRSLGEKLVVIIISEDGMVNIVPELRPILKRADIGQLISEYKSIVLDEKIDVGKFNKLTDCIYSKRFYLSQEQCTEINRKRKEIEDFLRSNLEGYIQIVREDLVQDSKFDESYLD